MEVSHVNLAGLRKINEDLAMMIASEGSWLYLPILEINNVLRSHGLFLSDTDTGHGGAVPSLIGLQGENVFEVYNNKRAMLTDVSLHTVWKYIAHKNYSLIAYLL